MKTLAEELREEEEAARRRFIHHTRPKRPLTLDEAIKLHRALINSSDHDYDITTTPPEAEDGLS